MREFNKETGASPYESLMVGDMGDVYLTMYDVPCAAKDIERQYEEILATGCKTLTLGGDHTITYPILRAYKVNTVIILHEICYSILLHSIR